MNNHFPVMISEVISILKISPGNTYIDCTFGRGGHTSKILSMGGNVIGIDRDLSSIEYGKTFFKEYIESGKLILIHEKFSNLSKILKDLDINNVDAILADFGMSSPQIDDSFNGFSYMNCGPLKMQMGINDVSAYNVVNEFSEEEIANIIYLYGEERYSRKIAKKITEQRKISPIESTFQLKDIIMSVIKGQFQIKSVARVFQAIRIYVNDELEEIKKFLTISESILKPNGILCAITFHSIEDRIVKRFLLNGVESLKDDELTFKKKYYENAGKSLFTKCKKIFPSNEELTLNSRSRSAILRYGVKIN